MRIRWMCNLTAIVFLLVGVGMVSADTIEDEIEFEGRPVQIILPQNFDMGNDLMPLILHLHGSVPFPNVPDVELDNSGYRDLPGKYRVMVVAPRAVLNPIIGNYDWDTFDSLTGCGSTNEDDVGFLNRLLDKLLEDYPVDPQRIYIYGYSKGAAMAHRMACANAERFAGIVAGAGFTLGNLQLCAPSVPISVLQFHSVADEVVLFNGGNLGDTAGIDPGNPACIIPGAVELLTRWADLNGCVGELKTDKKPKYDLTTPGFAAPPGIAGGVEGKETTVNKFEQCPKGYDVELWALGEGVPHPPLFYHFGPNGIKTLAEKSWKFLRRHKRKNDH